VLWVQDEVSDSLAKKSPNSLGPYINMTSGDFHELETITAALNQ
jgi:hypothetical protein